VRDTGVGIPEEAMPYVFEMFRQVRAPAAAASGLASISCARFVDALDGTVDSDEHARRRHDVRRDGRQVRRPNRPSRPDEPRYAGGRQRKRTDVALALFGLPSFFALTTSWSLPACGRRLRSRRTRRSHARAPLDGTGQARDRNGGDAASP
jgi:hypothetical protein